MCSGGSNLIFKSRKAAETYGQRDAAVASGERPIVKALYIDFSPFVQRSDGARETFTDVVATMSDDPGLLAVFFEQSIAIFPDNTEGRGMIADLLQMLREDAPQAGTA